MTASDKKKIARIAVIGAFVMALSCTIKITAFHFHMPELAQWVNVVMNAMVVYGCYVLGRVAGLSRSHRVLCGTAMLGYLLYGAILFFHSKSEDGEVEASVLVFFILTLVMSVWFLIDIVRKDLKRKEKMLQDMMKIGVACLLLLTSCTSVAQPPFEYRGIYSPTNAREEVRAKYGTHHVDYDWDLWGHNLKKVVPAEAPREVYATVADTLCQKQFCFSSHALYRIIEAYILDQYGEGTDTYSARICIMPQDNRMACTCPRCRKLGNIDGNATPAVTDMLCRLAKRFPRHQFFTSGYHSTRIPPKQSLPDNVGTLISAIDLPLRANFTQSEGYRKFCTAVEEWQKVCSRLYVWDYERNYEDYLSPFPCLTAMQKRLQLYRDLGIKGIFINGSGDDYSSFDDVQTEVLAQLLNNPDLDVETAVADYFREAYPATHDLLTDYYLTLERRTKETNHILPLYGTMEEMVESYLCPDEFTAFRASLDKASKQTEKPERTRLNYLLTALSYTQLQLMKLQGNPDPEQRAEMQEILRGHRELEGMTYYSEAGGEIEGELREKN